MSDQIDPNTTSPQSLVDAALATPTTTPTTPPPNTEPIVPPMPPLAPLEMPTPDPVPPVSPAMGDETPLAFATTEQSSYLPPSTPVPPAPVMASEKPKKKTKLGVVIGGVLLLVLALGGGIGGYWYYRSGSTPSINSYHDQIVANQAKGQAQYVQNIKDKQAANPGVVLTNQEKSAVAVADKAAADAVQKLKDAQAVSVAGSINQNLAGTFGWCSNCGPGGTGRMATTADFANPSSQISGMYPSTEASVNKNGQKWVVYSNADTANAAVAFNEANGNILQNVAVYAGGSPNADGTLQAINLPTIEDIAAHPGQTWVPGGVGVVAGWHWTTCLSGNGVNGVGCDVGTTNDNTPNTPNTPTAPTMSCKGLASSPDVTVAAPAIGAKITFTCAGAVVPASAGTLSYKFRYSINSGAYTAMTNVTTTTAALTIAACGSYSVECQACATLSGVLTCDPNWTGATTQ